RKSFEIGCGDSSRNARNNNNNNKAIRLFPVVSGAPWRASSSSSKWPVVRPSVASCRRPLIDVAIQPPRATFCRLARPPLTEIARWPVTLMPPRPTFYRWTTHSTTQLHRNIHHHRHHRNSLHPPSTLAQQSSTLS